MLLGLGLQRQERPVLRAGYDVVGRRAVDRVRPGLFLLEYVAVGDDVQEGQAAALDAVVGVGRVDGLEEVAHVSHVYARLAHRVRLLDDLDHRALLQALDVLQLGEVVEGVAVELEGEAGAVARVLAVHQQLVDLLQGVG